MHQIRKSTHAEWTSVKKYVFKGTDWVTKYNLSVMSFVKKGPYGLASHSLAPLPEVTGGSNGTVQTEQGGCNQGGGRWVGAKKAINPINWALKTACANRSQEKKQLNT